MECSSHGSWSEADSNIEQNGVEIIADLEALREIEATEKTATSPVCHGQ